MTNLPPEQPPTLPPQKARQGRRGSPVLMVLVGGLILAMAVWAVVELYGWSISPSPEQQVGDPATVEQDADATGGIATTPPEGGTAAEQPAAPAPAN